MTAQPGGGSGSPNDPLLALLERLLDYLEDLVSTVGTQSGPLTGQDLTDATQQVGDAEDEIETLRDSGTPPSLSPANVGSVDTSVTPSGLPAHAQACRDLAQAAVTEAEGDYDHDIIGDKIATIEALLPDLKQQAGIT